MANQTDDMQVLDKMISDSASFNISEERFSLPRVEDYYVNNLSSDQVKSISESLGTDASSDSLFYLESPVHIEPGFYPEESVIIVRAVPIVPGVGPVDNQTEGTRAYNINAFDGDTLYFNLDNIEDSSQEFKVGNATFVGLKDYVRKNIDISNLQKEEFGLRLLGINCPEIPHYMILPKARFDNQAEMVTKKVLFKEAKNDVNYIYDKSLNHKDEDELLFVNIDITDKNRFHNKWHEVVDRDYHDESLEQAREKAKAEQRENFLDPAGKKILSNINDMIYYKIVSKDDSADYNNAKQGLEIREALLELLQQGVDFMAMIDFKSINRKSGDYPDDNKYDDDFFSSLANVAGHPIETAKRIWDAMFGEVGFRYLGFNMYGQDAYKRFLGAFYVKVPLKELGGMTQWVNVAKYLIQKTKGITILPEYSSDPTLIAKNDFASDAFNLWSYNTKNKKIVDALEEISKADFDNRRTIQKQITGMNFEAMKDWNVMIGDCLFMVPPTSIRTVTQTTAQRVPLIRSKGSMTKGAVKSERFIEMTLYFNEEEGINGKAFTTTVHNESDEQITYYMNGLRTLIAMFKFTPFLPIENTFINKTLNIEAVSLVNLQVSTMPNYPKCLAATLTLQEFNYHVYMPEIPVPDLNDPESYDINLFARTIHYDTMRWYYQRAILNGQALRQSGYAPNSKEYLAATFGNKTCLQPMAFESSGIEFYVPDKDLLDKQLNYKIESLSKTLKTQYNLSENSIEWIKHLAYVYQKLESLDTSDGYKKALAQLQRDENGAKLYYSGFDRNGGTEINSGSGILTQQSKVEREGYSNPSGMINSCPLYKLKYDSNKDSYTTVVDSRTMLTNYLDPLYNQIFNHFSGYLKGLWMDVVPGAREYIKDSKGNILSSEIEVTFKLGLGVNREIMSSNSDLENFFKVINHEIGQTTDAYYDMNLNTVKVEMKSKFKFDANDEGAAVQTDGFYITSGPGRDFLRFCANRYAVDGTSSDNPLDSSTWGGVTSDEQMKEATSTKDNTDEERVDTIKFVRFPIDNLNVKNISCVFGNTMSKIELKMLDGAAPQYCGGQDTMIEIHVETMDQHAVEMLNYLPRMAAQYVREYRLILPCWPLRIDNELTRLLGVNEVLVESVDTTTVPGYPGLFNITIRLMSVDRTSRNKEALKKLDVASNAGAVTTENNSLLSKSYFDLKNSLAKTEIYPDLEIPTLVDLERKGFKFIRYASKEAHRIYPDPDFYFVYAHALGSEIFRNTILNSLSSNEEKSYELTDKYGAALNITTEKTKAYTMDETKMNEQAAEMAAQKAKIKQAIDQFIAREIVDKEENTKASNAEIVDAFSSMTTNQTWDIAETVRCMFREKRYEKLLNENDKFYTDVIKERVDTISSLINKVLNNPIEAVSKKDFGDYNSRDFLLNVTTGKQSKLIQKGIENAIEKILVKELKEVLTLLDINDNVVFLNTIIKVMMAAADTASGEIEYEGDKSKGWQARMFINTESIDIDKKISESEVKVKPYSIVTLTEQGRAGAMIACDFNEAMLKGKTFGPFQIKIGKDNLFLDPYYSALQLKNDQASKTEVEAYKKGLLVSPDITAEAFLRNMLVWFKKMLDDGILLSIYEIVQTEAIQAIANNNYANYAHNINLEYQSTLSTGAEALPMDTGDSKGIFETINNMWQEHLVTKDMSADQKAEYEKLKVEAEQKAKSEETINKEIATNIQQILIQNKTPLAVGKFFVSMLMTLTSGNQTLYNLMKERNYDALNDIVRGAQLPGDGLESFMTRKFVRALVGREVIQTMEQIGIKGETVSQMMGTIINERVYINAAEDPKTYIRDSFYDMIINDKRGRMARAFPTFYMMFIDEGREIGLWKLNDNFYNMSAIADIQVVKSRKIAADTAKITMTNMFKTYTTDDEDSREMAMDVEVLQNYQYTWKDVYNSIFSPRTYFDTEYLKRQETVPVQRAQMKPGVRLHLRMGYGGDASELPIVFNGVVTEVMGGEVIEIICQGDGVELTNPILSTSDAEDVAHDDDFVIGRIFENWFTKGASPRTILGSLLTTKGGWMKKQIYNITSGRFFNQNPYGIVHFGDPMYDDIFQGSECVQNIYEALHQPSWDVDKATESNLMIEYSTEDIPKISAHVFGKSYWDIMGIAAGAAPDFICSTVPFGLRSSIFYGLPRYYYAYEYTKEKASAIQIEAAMNKIEQLKQESNVTQDLERAREIKQEIKTVEAEIKVLTADTSTIVKEKRKPFQQFHIYSSYGDIIGNNIMASSKEVRTCAVGLYQEQGAFGKDHMARVGPMWVDFDIYPEKQRTMTVDTQFIAKGVPVLGDVIPFLNKTLEATGVAKNGYEVAWRITARALKDSIKDMYQGELIVIGDPSVKPYDKMWIDDVYEGIQGACEVEAVVHSFNAEEGFTSSLFADCIANIDDRHEQITQNIVAEVAGRSLAVYTAAAVTAHAFKTRSKPFIHMLMYQLEKTGVLGKEAANELAKIVGQEELLKNEKVISNIQTMSDIIGLNKADYRLFAYKTGLDNWRKTLEMIGKNDVKSLTELSEYYAKLSQTLTDADPKDLIEVLTLSKDAEVDGSDVKKALTELTGQKKKLRDASKLLKMTPETRMSMLQIIQYADTVEEKSDEVKASVESLRLFLKNDKLKNADLINTMAKDLKVIGSNLTGVDDIVKTTNLTAHVAQDLEDASKTLSFLDNVFDDAKTYKTLAKGAKGALNVSKFALGAAAIAFTLEMLISSAIVGFAYEYVERWMKNLQVLQVFPLKKHGKVMTAGLDGSKGLVVGSPTENINGTVENWIADAFGDKVESPFASILKSMFVSTDMRTIANTYRRRNDLPEPGTTIGIENITNQLMSTIASDLMKSSSGYSSMLLIPRIKDLTSPKALQAYKNLTVQKTEDIELNPKVTQEMIMIDKSKVLSKAKANGRLTLIHDIADAKKINLVLEGKTVTVNAIESKVKDKTVYDLPLVRPDLIYFIEKVYQKVENTFAKQDIEQAKKYKFIIQSALRAGENTWHSTGLACQIELPKNDICDLETILEVVKKEQQSENYGDYFQYVKADQSNAFKVLVYPAESYDALAFKPETKPYSANGRMKDE